MGKTIMIVDDSATVRQAVSLPLQKHDYLCVEAVDGADALTKLAAETVDLVITDINMPNLDGFDLVREIRKMPRYRFVPIVVLTTETNDELKMRGRDAGATGWIVKPFHPDQLIKVTKMLLK